MGAALTAGCFSPESESLHGSAVGNHSKQPLRRSDGSDEPEPGQSPITTAYIDAGEDPTPEETIYCEICTEEKHAGDMFAGLGCRHVYCKDCIGRHIAAKLQDNKAGPTCPAVGCEEKLLPEQCMEMLPEEVSERWGNALCVSSMTGERRIDCPFDDCRFVYVTEPSEKVERTECVGCRRSFCAECDSPWHDGFKCREFQRLRGGHRSKGKRLLDKLAKKEKWKMCPSCKLYVEKTSGCKHMTCRCGYEFCYKCGFRWINPKLHSLCGS